MDESCGEESGDCCWGMNGKYGKEMDGWLEKEERERERCGAGCGWVYFMNEYHVWRLAFR